MKYKRLTRRNEDGTTWVKCSVCDIQDKCDFTKETCCQELQDRLAELEDKIEQGTLVELDMKLPFKVGNTAYWLNGLPNCIQEYKVLGYSFDCFCGLRVDLGDMQPILFRCFGIKLFSSREEAEKRLKELQNG